MSILWAPVFLVYEPIKQTVVCIKYFVEFKTASLSDKTDGVEEKLNKTLAADFALLHHKFYMVLIEDAAQVYKVENQTTYFYGIKKKNSQKFPKKILLYIFHRVCLGYVRYSIFS